MADESCAFPGGPGELGKSTGTSRTPGQWLDRATAEQLLDGAPLEALDLFRAGVDARTAEESARVVRALTALRALGEPAPAAGIGHPGAAARGAAGAGAPAAAPGTHAGHAAQPGCAEMPGEAAALAAFREAHGVRRPGAAREAGASATDGAPVHRLVGVDEATALPDVEIRAVHLDGSAVRGTSTRGPRADATRDDRARRGSLRFGLVTSIAACMLGGVTVAAATSGVLPSPFGGTHRPSPSVSVPGTGSSAHPQFSPTSGASGGDSTGDGPSRGGAPDHGKSGDEDEHGGGKTSENWLARMKSACEDYRSGRDLDDRTTHELHKAAKGSGQIESFCAGVLSDADGPGRGGQKDPQKTQDAPDGSGFTSGNDGGNHGGNQGGADGDDGPGDDTDEDQDGDQQGPTNGGPPSPEAGLGNSPSVSGRTDTPPIPPETTPGVTLSGRPTQ